MTELQEELSSVQSTAAAEAEAALQHQQELAEQQRVLKTSVPQLLAAQSEWQQQQL